MVPLCHPPAAGRQGQPGKMESRRDKRKEKLSLQLVQERSSPFSSPSVSSGAIHLPQTTTIITHAAKKMCNGNLKVSKETFFGTKSIIPKCNVTFGMIKGYRSLPLLPSAGHSDLLNSWDLSVGLISVTSQNGPPRALLQLLNLSRCETSPEEPSPSAISQSQS